jgi:hypothetical protein
MKKAIKKLDCKIFKREALKSLRLIKVWSCSCHCNSKSNMRILTKNFWEKGRFINDGKW